MRVKEIMQKVKSVESTCSVKDAAELMSRLRMGSLIVKEGKKVVGIITERDIMSKVVSKDKQPGSVKVKDIMSSRLVTTEPEALIDDAVYLMLKHKIKKLPVIKDKELVGILTSTDLVKNSDEIGQFYFFD